MENDMSYFTKYVCFYELDKNNILMLNTLTSALDIIDHKTFSTNRVNILVFPTVESPIINN